MTTAVAVLSALPVFRAGLEDLLEKAGFTPERPTDLDRWALDQHRAGRRCGAFISVRTARDIEPIQRLTRRGVTVVAVLAYPEAMMFAYALGAGAATCIPLDAEPHAAVDAMATGLRDQSLMPRAIAMEIAHRAIVALPLDETNDAQWLRDLASGTTIATLAAKCGYSERAMYRKLRNLYDRIGASGRIEAIELAEHLGLI